MFNVRNNFKIYDSDTSEFIMQSQEELVKIMGLEFRGVLKEQSMEPFNITVTASDGEQVIRVKRRFSIRRGNIYIFDENDQLVGGFRPYSFWTVAHFKVLDVNDRVVFWVKRKWFGPKMLFVCGKDELARLTHVRKGKDKYIAKPSDDHILKISDSVAPNDPVRQLIFGVVVCMRGISTNPFYF
jgi:hypothetical protein